MWLSRNDVIFYKMSISSYMQVIFIGTHWARTWAVFQKEEKRHIIQDACQKIEIMTIEIFTKHEWWSSNKLRSSNKLSLWQTSCSLLSSCFVCFKFWTHIFRWSLNGVSFIIIWPRAELAEIRNFYLLDEIKPLF
jgi:hypothetical protein